MTTPMAAILDPSFDTLEPALESAGNVPRLVGLSFRTADLELRSKLGFTPSEQAQTVLAMRDSGVAECLILSTCNRAEVYFTGCCFHHILGFLADRGGMSVDDLMPHVYQKGGEAAISHMFSVAAGLDSAVIGETEILAQFKEAWRISSSHRATGRVLEMMCRSALEASKRIRTETGICKGVTSVGSLAVREAAKFGVLAHKRVLLIGAGKIAERVAKELEHIGVGSLVVANRSVDNAIRFTKQYGGRATGLAELDAELQSADVVFAAATSATPLITRQMAQRATTVPSGRQLVLIDLGVPRNVDPACAEMSNVELIDMECLASQCHANSERRLSALTHARQVLREEIERFQEEMVRREASSTIGALVGKGEEVRKRNLEWAMPRLAELDEKERKVVEDLTMRIVKGLLESPIAELKVSLTAPHQRELVARLFGLEASANG